jgi:hypothetical protein
LNLRHIVVGLALAGLSAFASAAPTGSLTLSPASGAAPYSAKLLWNVTGVASCSASGAWSGVKAVSGTQDVTITAATTFTLSCGVGIGDVTVRWVPPTLNTDGSTLQNLAGFNVYAAVSGSSSWKKVGSVGKGVYVYVDDQVTSGKWDYMVTSVNSDSVESDPSAIATITVVGGSWTQDVKATVTKPKPMPPTGVTTAETIAYEFKPSTNTLAAIGLVPSGIPCGPETKTIAGVTYCRLDRTNADLWTRPADLKLNDVWVRAS